MKIYSKSGDNGRSSTLNRTSLPKNSPVFELLGSLDELNSFLSLAKSELGGETAAIIAELQNSVSLLAAEVSGGKRFADLSEVSRLEKAIDKISSVIPEGEQSHPIGKNEASSRLDVARAAARRAERAAVATQTRGGITKELLSWLNRLSDLLYVLARLCDESEEKREVKKESPAGIASFELEGFCNMAEELCLKTRQYAKANGVSVVVAVSDAAGHPVGLQREDGAYIASIDIALNKAFTSASLKMSTAHLAELAKPEGPLYGIQNTNGNKIVIFGGGEPLIKNGVIVGAIGVSGGSAEQDTAFAEWGKKYFEKEM